MDALGKSMAVFAICAILLSAATLVCEESDAEPMDGLMIYQVNPKTCEGFALHNYGSSSIQLKDYIVSDQPNPDSSNEGSFRFISELTIGAGETFVFASEKQEGNYFSNQPNTYLYGKNQKDESLFAVTSKFTLKDSGDDLYLFKDGKAIDAVCYGSVTIKDESLWTGTSVKVSNDRFIQRSGSDDTNSAADWEIFVYGWTDFAFDPNLKYDAVVTPFLFPESGGVPVLKTLESATESIRVEIYMISDKNVIGLLVEKAKSGVDVDVLLEANPLGMSSLADCSGQLTTLINAGGEVRLIGAGSSDRYSYDHAKFAIVDGDTTIVTSENWTSDNLNGDIIDNPYSSSVKGNRGWGAIVESTDYSNFMNTVFENDWSMDYGDVATYQSEYPRVDPKDTYYESPSSHDFPSYSAKVTPILSNDSSYPALEYYASIAEDRLYSEQQSLDKSYTEPREDGPLGLFNAASERGVDTRLIFGAQVDSNRVLDINARSSIKAASMTTPYVHNKGVVCDDVSWVSSVNWTENSFHNNREVCVAIHSKEIADFFATSFLKDFERYYTFDGFSAYFSEFPEALETGKECTVTVTVSPSSGEYTFKWNLGDGSEVRSTTVGRIVFEPKAGEHTLTVVIENTAGDVKTLEQKYTVSAKGDVKPPEGEGTDEPSGEESPTTEMESLIEDNLYLIVAALLVIISVIGAIAKGSSKKKKGRR